MKLHGVIIIGGMPSEPTFMAEVVSVGDDGNITDDFKAETGRHDSPSKPIMLMQEMLRTGGDNPITWDLEMRDVKGNLTGKVLGSKNSLDTDSQID